MKQKAVSLTDRFIRNLRTDRAQEDYFDAVFQHGSLSLRVSKTGRKTFHLRYYTPEGKRRQVTLGVYP